MTRVLVSGVVLDQRASGVLRHNRELLPRVASALAAGGGELAVIAPREGLAFDLGPDARELPTRVPSGPAPIRAAVESRALAAELDRATAEGAPYDVVHSAHLPAPRLPRRYVGHVARTHLFHDLRSLDARLAGPLRRAVAGPAITQAVEGAAQVMTVSESVADELVRRFGVDRARLAQVPNAGDHFEPRPRRVDANAPLLHVGHLEPRKNLELLLEAIALAPDLPDLVLVGAAKGGESARLAARARELGVTDRVLLAGALPDDDLAGWYARAACVVIPSRLEGFGIGALEAQLARAPLAVSDLPALVEVAGAETPRFAPDSAEACVRAIRTALDATEDELEAAATRARRYSWDASAERLLAAFEAAAGCRR